MHRARKRDGLRPGDAIHHSRHGTGRGLLWQRDGDAVMRHATLPLACTLLLAACAGLPERERRPEPKPMSHYDSQRSLTAPAAAWPADKWWNVYGDAQLDTLIEEALASAPSLAIAQARLQRAQAQAQVAKGATQPQVNANASISQQRQS